MRSSGLSTKKSCNIRDVAEHVGVSPGMVSRILNCRPGIRVSEHTRKKVLDAASILNYTPNINAQRLFTKHTKVIGLVMPSYNKMGRHIFEDQHLTRMISGLEKGLSQADYSILLIFCDDKFVKEKRHLELFRSCGIDGMIIWGAYENDTFWEDLVTEKYPYLFLVNVPRLTSAVNHLVNDCEEAGFLLADHLLIKGHRRLAWLQGKSNISITSAQSQGIDRALRKYNMTLDDISVIGCNFTVESGYAIAEELLDGRPGQITAIIAANMGIAAGVMNYARSKNIAIPGELAVGCCNSLWDYNGELRDLTRVRVNDLLLGEIAAKSILDMINGKHALVRNKYEVELLTGKTS